jgi:hypothetical protein
MKRMLISVCFAGFSILFAHEPRKSEPAPEEAWINTRAFIII